ncbi:CDP-alcohol phosphatidyltransferase family protein [Inmirania thermothiophila]|uniref:CDP-diacylglycerol--glycerol-3-phosphate 3-phosphatidyltransferase n=1 Tax=Inmirania thermothiophila TaxID=1750597 RepID=A0A3N1Y7A4_9GAMM|nr:CDP-alcohol phosphatidyltransferase family protein [Inmirania thermothiophila]ROR34655.1 CDP-diacylglycerol--glycerol-3-phosphate 3-phosphatidyltransferase [Inmirania thermothiophila]
MANLVTTLRFLLLFLLVWMAYQAPPLVQLANAPLVALIFALDGLDGYIARRRGEESLFGAIFDIAVDRVVENVLWVVLADLDLVPVWVPIVFLTRGILVDSLRSQGAARGETPFGMMQTRIGRFLVAGRFMRLSYGVIKGVTFGWILFLQPWPALAPSLWAQWSAPLGLASQVLYVLAVVLCLLRGLPVLVEVAVHEAFRSRPGREAAP